MNPINSNKSSKDKAHCLDMVLILSPNSLFISYAFDLLSGFVSCK